MKRTFTVVAALGVLAAALFAVTGSAAPDNRLAAKQPIVIGMPLALTGIISFYDQPSLATARIAVKEINAKGGVLGRPLKIVTADTKSELNLIRPAALDVIGKGATFMIPTLDYDFGGPSAREAQQRNLIAISLAGDPRFGIKGIGPLVFNQFPGGPTEGAAAATFAYQVKKWRNAYILEDPTLSYTKSFIKYFKFSWNGFGGKTVGDDTFMNSDPSIATQITRLKNTNPKPDFIFLGSYAPGGASATKQLRAAGVDLPIISGAGFDGTFWVGAVPNISNFFAVVGGITTKGADPNRQRRAIYDKYRATYHKEPPLGEQTLNGYSAVYAWATAATRAKSTETSKVAAELDKFRNEPLPIGKTTWTPTCHIVYGRPMPIAEFVNGKERFAAEP